MKKPGETDRENIIAYEKKIINELKNLTDKSGRKISELFIELPSKEYYSDYYNIIKNPISISIINNKIKKGEYPTLDSLYKDLKLMQDNANTYNKKNSLVCKDAAVILRTFEKMRDEYNNNSNKENTTSLVSLNVDNIKSILKLVKNYKNSKGKFIADSFREIPDEEDFPDYYQNVNQFLSLKIIRKKLNQNGYQDFQEFVQDFEKMCHDIVKYRKNEEPEIEEEGKELLKYFSEICKPKPAESSKNEQENPNQKHLKSIVYKSETIQIGDFVHIINENDNRYPLILQIFDMWIDETNVTRIHGIWFLIPEQTVYPASKRFLENEVFRTTHYETYSIDKIIDKCYVLYLKDYCRGFPKGSENKKVYVCESRYIEAAKTTTKIKNWTISMPQGYKELEDSDLILHKTPLTLKRFVLITPENSDIPIRVPYTPEGNITLKRGAGGLDLSKFDTSILENASKNKGDIKSPSSAQDSYSSQSQQSHERKRLGSEDQINSPYNKRRATENMLYPNAAIQNPSINQLPPINSRPNLSNNNYPNNNVNNSKMQYNNNYNINNNSNNNNYNNNNNNSYLGPHGYSNPNYLNNNMNNTINNSNSNNYTNDSYRNEPKVKRVQSVEELKKKLKNSYYLSSPPNLEIGEQLKLYHSEKYLDFIKNRKEQKSKQDNMKDSQNDLKDSQKDLKYLSASIKGLTELWNHEAKAFKARISI